MENIDSELLNISDFQTTYSYRKKNADLFYMCSKFYDNAKIKIAFFLFMLFIILNTDIYAENILSRLFKNSYEASTDTITEKGIIISGMILAFSYIILDLLYENDLI